MLAYPTDYPYEAYYLYVIVHDSGRKSRMPRSAQQRRRFQFRQRLAAADVTFAQRFNADSSGRCQTPSPVSSNVIGKGCRVRACFCQAAAYSCLQKLSPSKMLELHLFSIGQNKNKAFTRFNRLIIACDATCTSLLTYSERLFCKQSPITSMATAFTPARGFETGCVYRIEEADCLFHVTLIRVC